MIIPNPDDNKLGKPGGIMVKNGKDILAKIDEIDKANVSYYLCRPVRYFSIPFLGLGFSFNGFGHSAMRLKFKDGRDIVMNIEGKRGERNMVNWYKTEEFLFGLKESDEDNSSKGEMYNRNIVEFRMKVDEKNLNDTLDYCLQLQDSYNEKKSNFDIALGPIYNFIRKILPSPTETGNCAWWTSSALKNGNIIKSRSMFPKSIGIDMFENMDVTVVSYERIEHSHRSYGKDGKVFEFVAPFQPFRQFAYGNFAEASRFRVYVPKRTITLELEEKDPQMKPSPIRNIINSKPAIATSTTVCAYTTYRIFKKLRRLKFRK